MALITLEDLQDEVERLLRKCPEDVVVAVATHLKIDCEDRNKRSLLRDIQEVLDDTTESDEKVAIFTELLPLLPPSLQTALTLLLSP